MRSRKSVPSTFVPSEHQEQVALVNWFKLQYPGKLIIAIPNGSVIAGDARVRAIRSRRLKDEGMLPGCADLFIACASSGFHGLFIEMKSATGSASKAQIDFGAHVNHAGYAFKVCRGFAEAQTCIDNYFNG